MQRYLFGRISQAVVALLGVTLVAFLLVNLSGDPSYILLAPEAGPAERAAFRERYGLDEPLLVQYSRYLTRLLRGDFGLSFAQERPAMTVVLERVNATLELALWAVATGVALGIPSGVLAAIRSGTWIDRAVMALVLLGQSVPTFWLGILMIRVFAVNFGWLPVSGRGSPEHLVMPVLALGLYLVALLARITRSEMLEVLDQDYIRTARAKGLAEWMVTGSHALRNALLSIVTLVGLQFGALMGGAVITETVFAWPGIGTLVLDSILKKDYPVVVAATVFVATTFIFINTTLDVLYGYLDPRVRRGET